MIVPVEERDRGHLPSKSYRIESLSESGVVNININIYIYIYIYIYYKKTSPRRVTRPTSCPETEKSRDARKVKR